jgi:hypothetical protein
MHPRRQTRGRHLRYWHRPGLVSWGEFVDVDVFSTGPLTSAVLVTASPILPLNLFAQGACERDVDSVMKAIDALGVPDGPARELGWNDPIPVPSEYSSGSPE